jgi:hypothetical protein
MREDVPRALQPVGATRSEGISMAAAAARLGLAFKSVRAVVIGVRVRSDARDEGR